LGISRLLIFSIIVLESKYNIHYLSKIFSRIRQCRIVT
jgi:hypothetical protein